MSIRDDRAEPFDHLELLEQQSRSRLGRAIANLRAALCGFTQSRQHFYEGLLFQLEVGLGLSGRDLERRIQHAAMLEAAGVPEDVVQIVAKICTTNQIAQEDVIRLQEVLGIPREHWRFLRTKQRRCPGLACVRDWD